MPSPRHLPALSTDERAAIRASREQFMRTPTGKYIAPRGYSSYLTYVHLSTHHADGTWCSPRCLAKVMLGKATKDNVEKIRGYVSGIFNYALDEYKQLLVIARDLRHPHSVLQFRLSAGTSEDVGALERQLADLARRGELRGLRIQNAHEVLDRSRRP